MGDADRSRRRVRSLLSNYYGVGDKETVKNEADVKNIDSDAFDATTYVQELIKDQSVANLISRDNNMVSEIKSLDSDMQMLVYENYNKFISATDTIRKMKEKVETMEGSMSNLQSSMEKISECSVSINSNLSDHRVQIEELQGIRRFLKKLQFLSDLPSRLNYALDVGSFGTAIKYMNASEKFLESYAHKQTFSNIKNEVDAAKRKMREKIKEKMGGDEVSMAELSECVGHLLDLKEPEEAMRNHFLDKRKGLLLKYLDDEKVRETASIDTYIAAQCNLFLAEYTEFVKSYSSLFLKDPAATEKGSPAQTQLLACTKELFEIFFGQVKERFKGSKGNDQNPRSFIEALHKFSLGMQGAHQVFPHARLMDRGTEIIESTVRHEVDESFVGLHDKVEASIVGMNEALRKGGSEYQAQTGTSLSSMVGIISQQIVREVESVLKNLESVVSTAEKALFGSESGTFLALVYGHVRQFFDFLDRRMLELARKGPADSPPAPTFVLMLTRLSLEMEANMIVQISHVLSTSFPARHGGADTTNTENHLSMLNLADTKTRSRVTTQQLLLLYVQSQGQTLSNMMRKSMETSDWVNTKAPQAVRGATEMIVSEIQTMDTEIAQIFPDDPNVLAAGPSKAASDYRARRAAGRHNAIEKDVQRLFQKKIRVFGSPECNRHSITTAVLKVVAKTFSECVRLLRFSTYGYQQMQVDLHYMRVACRGITMDDGILQSLFDEVVSSCADACSSPKGLETHEIEACCQNTET